MRARNLKPGLFNNELLGSADPLITILFEGLWCVADREGRLEDRPLRLCAQIFPYRRAVTEKKVDKMLEWLDEHGFIVRYESVRVVSGDRPKSDTKKFIQVIGFSKHQNPHKNESQSRIPAPQSAIQSLSSNLHGASTGVSTVQAPESSGADTEGAPDKHPSAPASSLNPDSLIPDSSLRDTCEHPTRSNRDESRPPLAPDQAWRDVTECDPQAYESWLAYREDAGDPVPARVRIEHAKFLGGKGGANAQREFIATLIRLQFRRLHDPIPARGNGAPDPGSAKSARAAAERDELERLKARRPEIGIPTFRDPEPHESPAVYETAMRLAARDAPAPSGRASQVVRDLATAKKASA